MIINLVEVAGHYEATGMNSLLPDSCPGHSSGLAWKGWLIAVLKGGFYRTYSTPPRYYALLPTKTICSLLALNRTHKLSQLSIPWFPCFYQRFTFKLVHTRIVAMRYTTRRGFMKKKWRYNSSIISQNFEQDLCASNSCDLWSLSLQAPRSKVIPLDRR